MVGLEMKSDVRSDVEKSMARSRWTQGCDEMNNTIIMVNCNRSSVDDEYWWWYGGDSVTTWGDGGGENDNGWKESGERRQGEGKEREKREERSERWWRWDGEMGWTDGWMEMKGTIRENKENGE
jgi:hypothetical protein